MPKHQNKKKINTDVINAAFNPETRSRIANITKLSDPSTPSLMKEGNNKTRTKEGGGEHPLLSLHQSVSEDGSAIQQEQTIKLLKKVSDITEKKQKTSTTTTSDNMNGNQHHNNSVDNNTQMKKSKVSKALSMLIKTIVINTLLVLWIVLMHSVINNADIIDKSSYPTIITDGYDYILNTFQLLGVVSYVQDFTKHITPLLPSISFDSTTKRHFPVDQFEQRIELGVNLLRKYNDASGSEATCESVLQAIIIDKEKKNNRQQDNLLYLVSSSTSTLNINENRILSQTLLCLGEARLSMYSDSSFSSSKLIKRGQLMKAKDSYEAATAVDSTNTSARSGLGLVYLLLGVMNHNDEDDSMNYIFQSIQHLKAAIGLAEVGDDVRTAALHNLGLAYIALDEKSSSTSDKTTYFLDWLATLRSTNDANLESLVLAGNEGAALLQSGKVVESISSLESTSTEICTDNSFTSESCMIVQHNLAVARDAMYGENDEPGIHYTELLKKGTSASTVYKVARWNSDSSFGLFVADPIGSEETNFTLSDKANDLSVVEVGEVEKEEPAEASLVDEGTRDDTHVEDDIVDEETSPNVELPEEEEEEVNTLPSGGWGLKPQPQMQNALEALEKVATEGTPRTRMLLALARARVSSGDITGGVDAVLSAINAAKSDEETETSTLYLETLMEKLSEKGVRQETIPPISKEQAMPEKRDFSVSELEMKLELERLKYKVLEQDMKMQSMRLGHQQILPQYDNRAIEYQQNIDNHMDNTPSQRQALGIIKENVAEPIKGEKKPVKLEPVDPQPKPEMTAEEAPVLDEVEDDESESVILKPESSINTEVPSTDTEPEVVEEEPVPPDNVKESEVVVSNEGINIVDDGADIDLDLLEVPGKQDTSTLNVDTPVEEQPIELPKLFSPTLEKPTEMSATARSKMKVADAYLDKGQYALASKQFLNVIRREPDHLPAHLGYATVLERGGKSKQISTSALAYGEAARVAVTQGDVVDPMGKAGSGGLAENILRRALQLAKSSPISDKLETLQKLSTYAHTNALAADIYYEIGLEIVNQGIDGNKKDEAVQAFCIANEFIVLRNDDDTPYHVKSMVQLAKIALEHDSNANKVIDYFKMVKDVHMDDDVHVDLLVILGYATVLERGGKSKQISTSALAYGEAARVAVTQGDVVDPMGKAGSGGLAENILRRALQLAKSSPISDKLETLQKLSTYAHTNALAADIYYEIGLEIVNQGIDGNKKDEAVQAFCIANEFIVLRNDDDTPYHVKSMVQLAKIALEHDSNANKVIDYFKMVKDVHMDDDVHVDLLVIVGRAHVSLGEIETAISEFTRALSFPQSSSTASAHYEMAMALKKSNADTQEIKTHFEKALDMGVDATQEVIEALGERNMSVIRALNRQYYQSMNRGGSADSSGGGGGILAGGGVGSQSSSVFAPQSKQEEASTAGGSDTLSLLEQGAQAYDGSEMGGEVEAESSLGSLKEKRETREFDRNIR